MARNIEQRLDDIEQRLSSLENDVRLLMKEIIISNRKSSNDLATLLEQFTTVTNEVTVIKAKFNDFEKWRREILGKPKTKSNQLPIGVQEDVEITASLLPTYFNENELEDLIIDMGYKATDIQGDTDKQRSHYLVNFAWRRNQFAKLIRLAKTQRPFAPWPLDTGQFNEQ